MWSCQDFAVYCFRVWRVTISFRESHGPNFSFPFFLSIFFSFQFFILYLPKDCCCLINVFTFRHGIIIWSMLVNIFCELPLRIRGIAKCPKFHNEIHVIISNVTSILLFVSSRESSDVTRWQSITQQQRKVRRTKLIPSHDALWYQQQFLKFWHLGRPDKVAKPWYKNALALNFDRRRNISPLDLFFSDLFQESQRQMICWSWIGIEPAGWIQIFGRLPLCLDSGQCQLYNMQHGS